MRRLTLTRRQFGALLGAALAAPAHTVRAQNQPRRLRIDISAFEFAPSDLTIQSGDTVEWVNHDIAPHTATGDSGRWETGQLDKGRSRAVSFDEPGEFPYHCAFHPHMRGRIVVKG